MSEIIKESIFVETTRNYFVLFYLESYGGGSHHREFLKQYKLDDPIMKGNVIKKIDIPLPLLSKGDNFYFTDTNEIVKIEDVMRTSEDQVVYVIATKSIIDKETLQQYEEDKKKHLENGEKLEKLMKRNWWQRLRNVAV